MAESVRSVGMRVVGDPRLLSVPLSPAVDGRVADRSQPQRADRPARLLGRPVDTSTCVVGGCITTTPQPLVHTILHELKAITDADD